jgi:hypothetical protein
MRYLDPRDKPEDGVRELEAKDKIDASLVGSKEVYSIRCNTRIPAQENPPRRHLKFDLKNQAVRLHH